MCFAIDGNPLKNHGNNLKVSTCQPLLRLSLATQSPSSNAYTVPKSSTYTSYPPIKWISVDNSKIWDVLSALALWSRVLESISRCLYKHLAMQVGSPLINETVPLVRGFLFILHQYLNLNHTNRCGQDRNPYPTTFLKSWRFSVHSKMPFHSFMIEIVCTTHSLC